MNKKKKVLFFLNSSTGGAERVTVTIGKMLPTDKYEVVFVLIGKSKGTMAEFIPKQYRVEYIVFRNIWLGVKRKFYKLMKEERPYAVFSSNMPFSVRILSASRRIGGIKAIIRNCNYFSTLRWDQILYCKLTYKYADYVIAQQNDMRDDILDHINLNPQKVIVLQNPIDKDYILKMTNEPSPYKGNEIKYLWVGRFDRTKGQDVLAKAFSIVSKKISNAHLYFVGNYYNYLFFHEVKQIVDDGQCSDRVHFIGYDSNPYRWMKYCDCFVLPSRIEGLPNSLIEAQYLGRPAVATRCIPIISQIVKEGVTGYTVPTEDPKAMAEAMLKAPLLGFIKSSYHCATDEDFIRLFE